MVETISKEFNAVFTLVWAIREPFVNSSVDTILSLFSNNSWTALVSVDSA